MKILFVIAAILLTIGASNLADYLQGEEIKLTVKILIGAAWIVVYLCWAQVFE